MNAFIERVNRTVQSEYLDRFYEETNIAKNNEILYDCLISNITSIELIGA